MPLNMIPTLVELKYAHDDGTSVALCKRLAACIEDGAAILSREDREAARLALMDAAGDEALQAWAKAGRLLQLQEPKP